MLAFQLPHGYGRDDAGHPLGAGMPSGAPLRVDGETHYAACLRLLRHDPCAYCGGPGGTVDHVEPKRRPVRGLGGAHSWLNVVGACEGCNGRKADKPLLTFLLHRVAPSAGSAPIARHGAGRTARPATPCADRPPKRGRAEQTGFGPPWEARRRSASSDWWSAVVG